MNSQSEILISCKNICKNFGATRALIDVDFELRRGEVCGLIGENGSGKSTLTSIFAGVQPQTSGELFCKGQPYRPKNMVDAQRHGIAMIVQEAATLPGLDVAGNIFIGNYQSFQKGGILNVSKMHSEADRILKEIGAEEIKSTMPLYTLNFENRKIVEIARALYLDPDVLIIDESTTALAQRGRTLLYKLIDRMKAENKAVIFISHDLEELEEVCNRITCLRDGVVVGHLQKDEMSVDKMRPMMVGRELTGSYYREDWDGKASGDVVLDVRHITSANGYVKNFSVQLHRGEILGFGGLAGCGMHEVGRMIFGLDEKVTGEVVYMPGNEKIEKISDSIRHNIGYISKDRDTESIILNASIESNTMMASYGKLKNGFLISPKAEKEEAEKQIRVMRVKCQSGKQFCSELSGGNKQKVAFSKWLAAGSEIFIMDCPTRGIDIGVKAAMYQMIYEFKKQGKAVIMISEELPELIGMSDRMIIMKDGKVSAEILRSKSVTDTQLIDYIV